MEKSMNVKGLKYEGKEFFYHFLLFTKPYHKLAPKQMRVIALMLYKRHMLSKSIIDEKILDDILFKRIKNDIKVELKFKTNQIFSNMMLSLRKTKALNEKNIINKALIPKVIGNNFKLIFNFDIDWNE